MYTYVSLNWLPSCQKGITVRVHYLYLVDDNEITGVVSDLTLCNDMNACMKIMSLADCVLEHMMDASIYKASPMYCYWLVGNDWFDSRGILWVCNAIGIVTAGMEYKSYTTCSVLLLWPIIVSGTAKASWRSESYMINIGLAFTFGGKNEGRNYSWCSWNLHSFGLGGSLLYYTWCVNMSESNPRDASIWRDRQFVPDAAWNESVFKTF